LRFVVSPDLRHLPSYANSSVSNPTPTKPWYLLKSKEVSLRLFKRDLGIINEALLDPTFPVQIIYPDSREWYRKWKSFKN
jgi:hypothetical protein